MDSNVVPSRLLPSRDDRRVVELRVEDGLNWLNIALRFQFAYNGAFFTEYQVRRCFKEAVKTFWSWKHETYYRPMLAAGTITYADIKVPSDISFYKYDEALANEFIGWSKIVGGHDPNDVTREGEDDAVDGRDGNHFTNNYSIDNSDSFHNSHPVHHSNNGISSISAKHNEPAANNNNAPATNNNPAARKKRSASSNSPKGINAPPVESNADPDIEFIREKKLRKKHPEIHRGREEPGIGQTSRSDQHPDAVGARPAFRVRPMYQSQTIEGKEVVDLESHEVILID